MTYFMHVKMRKIYVRVLVNSRGERVEPDNIIILYEKLNLIFPPFSSAILSALDFSFKIFQFQTHSPREWIAQEKEREKKTQ